MQHQGNPHGRRQRPDIHTLVIGGGQAGLATSYWLTRAGIDHLVLERRDRLGGGWLDRWDTFRLIAPNFTLLLPGMPHAGPDPDAFMPRDGVVDYVRRYAASFGAQRRPRHGRVSAAEDSGGVPAAPAARPAAPLAGAPSSTSTARASGPWCGPRATGWISDGWICRGWTSGDTRGTRGVSPRTLDYTRSDCPGCIRSRPR